MCSGACRVPRPWHTRQTSWAPGSAHAAAPQCSALETALDAAGARWRVRTRAGRAHVATCVWTCAPRFLLHDAAMLHVHIQACSKAPLNAGRSPGQLHLLAVVHGAHNSSRRASWCDLPPAMRRKKHKGVQHSSMRHPALGIPLRLFT